MGNTKSQVTIPDYISMSASSPYASAIANIYGTSYKLNDFLSSQNKTIENAIPILYQRLLNPSLTDPISTARAQAFTDAFNSQAQNSFENNIINPLSKRRMLRSSLLNDLTNNLQTEQTSQISNFNTNQLANSLDDTQSLINFYMNQYKNNSSYGQNLLNSVINQASNVNSYYSNNYRNGSLSSNSFNYGQLASAVVNILATLFG